MAGKSYVRPSTRRRREAAAAAEAAAVDSNRSDPIKIVEGSQGLSAPGLGLEADPDFTEGGGLGEEIVLPEGAARTALAKSRLAQVQRDQYGLPERALSLSDAQYRWLSHRLDSDSDEQADYEAQIDPVLREEWQTSPDFRAVQETCQENKREGFRILTAQLLPRTLRTLYDMLNSRNHQSQKAAATLILRSQALLIDRPPQTDQNALSDLLEVLRERREVTPMEVKPR